MLVVCRLAGLSALGAQYEDVTAYRQSGVEVEENHMKLQAEAAQSGRRRPSAAGSCLCKIGLQRSRVRFVSPSVRETS
jgi:hypothetical protein